MDRLSRKAACAKAAKLGTTCEAVSTAPEQLRRRKLAATTVLAAAAALASPAATQPIARSCPAG